MLSALEKLDNRIAFYTKLAERESIDSQFYVENHTFVNQPDGIKHPLDDIAYHHARIAGHFASLVIALIEVRDREQ